MSDLKIEKGIPIPPKGACSKEIFDLGAVMEVGDSVLFTSQHHANKLIAYFRRHDKDGISRKPTRGVDSREFRVWRTK